MSMDAEKSEHRVGRWVVGRGWSVGVVGGVVGSGGGEGVVFFQSSNLLNLFFPRNVAAVSKLLIAIGKVEPMGRGRGVELNGARRGRVSGRTRERESEGGLKGDRRVRSARHCGGQDVSVYREDRYEQHCRSFRSVSFRFASSPFRYVTLRLLGRASPRAI